MASLQRVLKPAVWLFYLVVVFEILFMISPFALHFYSAYGPALNVLHHWPATAWLTQFFLPHISQTRNPVLNALPMLGGVLIVAGMGLFLVGAIPIYWAKFRRRGIVTGGVYASIRHPQYVGLAIVGLGTLLLWPRFLVLITYVTMLFLYAALARWEEERCVAQFGDSYRAYQARTGRFLPQSLSKRVPRILPASGGKRVLAVVGLYVGLSAATVALAFALRDYALSQVSVLYMHDVAVLSPALLTEVELSTAYHTAMTEVRVQEALRSAEPTKLLVYVVPVEWYLPDLPMEPLHKFGGHHTPADFDRHHYKVLFTRARTHRRDATGAAIVKAAYSREPLVLVKVDIAAGAVTDIETPPPHVVWGDIPTPTF